ncbi:hypothetical protein HanXRQr2_Chr15g0715631 [Helianthus annuus]|uniref:Uncharacterized protein n=1 Tax=Helianthus annuus TaxID=4232 RepID=A0A9K3E5J0_HELAN|nr:hypothetical protein HanXRQr2_Chr15g0715631 [Helianthus annuus]KAJ0833124.1 hypothetical protein HanPSC8_Chr15g0686691 [Helianthus annuus]
MWWKLTSQVIRIEVRVNWKEESGIRGCFLMKKLKIERKSGDGDFNLTPKYKLEIDSGDREFYALWNMTPPHMATYNSFSCVTIII